MSSLPKLPLHSYAVSSILQQFKTINTERTSSGDQWGSPSGFTQKCFLLSVIFYAGCDISLATLLSLASALLERCKKFQAQGITAQALVQQYNVSVGGRDGGHLDQDSAAMQALQIANSVVTRDGSDDAECVSLASHIRSLEEMMSAAKINGEWSSTSSEGFKDLGFGCAILLVSLVPSIRVEILFEAFGSSLVCSMGQSAAVNVLKLRYRNGHYVYSLSSPASPVTRQGVRQLCVLSAPSLVQASGGSSAGGALLGGSGGSRPMLQKSAQPAPSPSPPSEALTSGSSACGGGGGGGSVDASASASSSRNAGALPAASRVAPSGPSHVRGSGIGPPHSAQGSMPAPPVPSMRTISSVAGRGTGGRGVGRGAGGGAQPPKPHSALNAAIPASAPTHYPIISPSSDMSVEGATSLASSSHQGSAIAGSTAIGGSASVRANSATLLAILGACDKNVQSSGIFTSLSKMATANFAGSSLPALQSALRSLVATFHSARVLVAKLLFPGAPRSSQSDCTAGSECSFECSSSGLQWLQCTPLCADLLCPACCNCNNCTTFVSHHFLSALTFPPSSISHLPPSTLLPCTAGQTSTACSCGSCRLGVDGGSHGRPSFPVPHPLALKTAPAESSAIPLLLPLLSPSGSSLHTPEGGISTISPGEYGYSGDDEDSSGAESSSGMDDETRSDPRILVSGELHLSTQYASLVAPRFSRCRVALSSARDAEGQEGEVTIAIFPNATVCSPQSGSASSSTTTGLALQGTHVAVRESGGGNLLPFCTSCDTWSTSIQAMTNVTCIHKEVARYLGGMRTPFRYPFTTLPCRAPSSSTSPPQPSGSPSSSEASPSAHADTSTAPTYAILLPSTSFHLYFLILPLHCPRREHFSLAPSVVQIAKSGRSAHGRCSVCVTGGVTCSHVHDAFSAAAIFRDPLQRKRASEHLKPPQTSTVHPLNLCTAVAYPKDPCPLPEVHPDNGGGSYKACQLCGAAFGGPGAQGYLRYQCPLFILSQSSSGAICCSLHRMFYRECGTPFCAGRNFYDGREHNVAVLSSMPVARGRPKDRAWGMSLQLLHVFLRRGVRFSWSSIYEHYFEDLGYPTRQDFTAGMQRALMYLLPMPDVPPIGDAVVLDVTLQTATGKPPLALGGTTSALGAHVCELDAAAAAIARGESKSVEAGEVAPSAPACAGYVNPATPVVGCLGDELPYLMVGLGTLQRGLTLADIRDFVLRLALNAAKRLPQYKSCPQDAVGYGTLSNLNSSGNTVKAEVLNGEVQTMVATLQSWCESVAPASSHALPQTERTPTAISLALSLRALLPLLSSLIAPPGNGEGEVQVPHNLAQLFFSLHTTAVCSPVARMPDLGAVFFPALMNYLRSLSEYSPAALDCPMPEEMLEPIAVGGVSFRHVMRPLQPYEAARTISWREALCFLSPEFAPALQLPAEKHALLHPILLRYGELALTVSQRSPRMLLNTPPDTVHPLLKTVPVALHTHYDRLYSHSVSVQAAADDPHNPHHSTAKNILAALLYQPCEEASAAKVNAQCGLFMPSLQFTQGAPIHFYDTHSKNDSSDCSSCHRTCLSNHCTKGGVPAEEAEDGCDHSFRARGTLGGSISESIGPHFSLPHCNCPPSASSHRHRPTSTPPTLPSPHTPTPPHPYYLNSYLLPQYGGGPWLKHPAER